MKFGGNLRLFVTNKEGKKVYLQMTALTKRELINKIGGHKFTLEGELYTVSNVKAEPSNDNAAVSMVIGGAIGLLGGVAGVVAGGALGGLIGNEKDKKDILMVERFNGSKS
ncbi:TPA: hypothetical protein I7181_22490 [Vibrio vulnificus]|nr:hypothetical protein [Vibrio vulnificus]HAT8488866.1 hypothetical protein [Vibrio vulnificus]HAT8516425.1 hypothetical protein [Vibrio vulnificus]